MRSPIVGPTEDIRLAPGAVPGARALTLRGSSFLAECIALRSLRGSSRLESESDPEAPVEGGQFSSIIVCKECWGLTLVPCGIGGGDLLPLLATSSVLRGEPFSVSAEFGERLRLSVGGWGNGDPVGSIEGRDDLLRNPAWKRLGLAAPRLVASGITKVDSSSVD